MVMLFDKKKARRGGKIDGDVVPATAGAGTAGSMEEKASEYISQARAILLEANVSGADARDGQGIFKKALQAQKNGDYGKSIELAMECIDIVDDILKNG